VLTRQGWLAAIASLALVATGRALGILELLVLGVAAAGLVVVSLAQVHLTRLRIEVRRTLEPPRVHAGEPARVELEVTNTGRRSTPLLTLRDPVGPTQTAMVLLAPLRPDATVRAGYRLPTNRRGMIDVGPLRVTVSDPFGLVRSSFDAAHQAELTVWPTVEPVAALPHTMGDDPHGGAEHPTPLATTGGDFHALRPYVVGDDLRRVHWPSTARRDDLLIRQDQMPWQGRATVVLDTRAAAHDDDTFERAVSAAASVLLACSHRGHLVRLVTSDGLDTGMAEGAGHLALLMEQLATVQTGPADGLGAVVEAVRRGGGAGAVAVLLGGAGGTGGTGGAATTGRLRATATITFVPGDTTLFGSSWALALQRRGIRSTPTAAGTRGSR
jgi:uncharacterized protein (DUF58 family)